MYSAGYNKTRDNKCCCSLGDSSRGMEASEVLRHYRGHGDPSSHHAGGDRPVWSVHAV